MQILLTQEEYENLVSKREYISLSDAHKDLCIWVAKNVPVTFHESSIHPNGCVSDNTAEYCDFCPAEKYCRIHGKYYHK